MDEKNELRAAMDAILNKYTRAEVCSTLDTIAGDAVVSFIEEHANHELGAADSPARAVKGILCQSCMKLVELHVDTWKAREELVAWSAEQKKVFEEQQRQKQAMLQVLRRQQEADLPEVRMTARYGRGDEDTPRSV